MRTSLALDVSIVVDYTLWGICNVRRVGALTLGARDYMDIYAAGFEKVSLETYYRILCSCRSFSITLTLTLFKAVFAILCCPPTTRIMLVYIYIFIYLFMYIAMHTIYATPRQVPLKFRLTQPLNPEPRDGNPALDAGAGKR